MTHQAVRAALACDLILLPNLPLVFDRVPCRREAELAKLIAEPA